MPTKSALQNWSIPLDRKLESLSEVKEETPPVIFSTLPVDVVVSTPSPEFAPSAPPTNHGFIHFHPKFRQWLHKCGVTTPESAINLLGEVVSGHADRHVVKVELSSGISSRVVFLKREHVVGWRTRWRNKLAGFGRVSKSEREARTLQALEKLNLSGPQWLAFGEDGTGRAFLLVDQLAGAVDLREFLAEYEIPMDNRRHLARQAGQALAELHAAGFSTPELGAKHCFVNPESLRVSLVDWQSTPRQHKLKRREVVRALGQLHASLAEDLASPLDRLRFLAMYRRTLRKAGCTWPMGSKLIQKILLEAKRVWHRSSAVAQRQPTNSDQAQRLVWLQGEEVVVIPELATLWPRPPADAPFYPVNSTDTPVSGARERFTFLNGTRAIVVRFHTKDRFGRLWAKLRERPWRSPAQKAARMLFHLAKHGIPAPRLLAFGQREVDATTADSFLAAELPPTVRMLPSLQRTPELLRTVGQRLRQLHEAGCRVNMNASMHDPLFVLDMDNGELLVGSPFALQLDKKLTTSAKQADFEWVSRSLVGLSHEEQVMLATGYSG